MFKFLRSFFSVSRPKTESVCKPNSSKNIIELFGGATADASMKISAVYSAVKLISEGVARLPLELKRFNSVQNCYVSDVQSELYNVLKTRPNRDMTAFDFWRAVVQQILLRGNAYILPSFTQTGDISSLTLLSPDAVNHDIYSRKYHVYDSINRIGGIFAPEDIVHLRNVSLDGGYSGVSTVQLAAFSLGIMSQADKNLATTLSDGGRLQGLLTGSAGSGFGAASMVQLKDVADSIEADIRAGRTVVPAPPETKYTPLALSPADARVLESKQVSLRDIARFFRVHPDLLYEGSNNTYKAAEVPNVMFLTQTLEPLLKQIESELLVKLLPRPLQSVRTIGFDREALYSTDLSTEALYLEKMLQTGIYTVNELRSRKGMRPVEGGNNPLVSANLRRLNDMIKEQKEYE